MVVRSPLRYSVVFTAAILAALVSLPCSPVQAQSLVEMYRSARFHAQAEHLLKLHGASARPIPVDRLLHPTDSIRAKMEHLFPQAYGAPEEAEPALYVRKWQLVPKLGRSWFEAEFQPGGWAFLGSNALGTLDTTFTRELRARLEATFGAPTQTISDRNHEEGLDNSEFVQFEYWFALNDTIPLKVMDVNGPFERGLVVASDRQYRTLLPELKQALLTRLIEDGERAPYVDYYYLPEQRMWFVSGFDGDRFFLKRIPRPNLRLGRPLLDAVLDR